MRYLKHILIILILVQAFFTGFGQIKLENEIIVALIKSEFKQFPNDTAFNRKGKIKWIKRAKKQDIILVNETEAPGKFINNGFTSIELDLSMDYNDKNRSKIHIDSISDYNGTIKYLSNEEINKIFEQGGWNKYHKTFGIIPLVKVSRPGLNRDKTEALIYYSNSIDGLGGAGLYFILEKIDGIWIVKDSILIWIS